MFIFVDSEAFGIFSILCVIAIIVWAIYYFIFKPKVGKKLCIYCNKAIDPSIMFCPYCERLMPIEDIKKIIGKYNYCIKSELELFDTEPNSSNVISLSIKKKKSLQ